MLKKTELILASQFPSRKKLLDILGIEYQEIPASIDESRVMEQYHNNPEKLVTTLAREKGEYVKKRISEALETPNALENKIIVACDTVNTCGSNEIMGKPKNNEEAKQMHMKLMKHYNRQHTGIYILDPNKNKSIVQYAFADIGFCNLTEEDMDSYIRSGEPLSFSGGFNPRGRLALTFGMVQKGYLHAEFAFPFEFLVPSLRDHGLLPSLEVKKIDS